jgi:L-ascorbate metabolism protein UlaG (beta-lactamase superfamily)
MHPAVRNKNPSSLILFIDSPSPGGTARTAFLQPLVPRRRGPLSAIDRRVCNQAACLNRDTVIAMILTNAVARLFAGAGIASALLTAQTGSPGGGILEQIRAHREGLAVWWVGNAGWLIKSQDVLIGIDLDLTSRTRVQPPPLTASELAGELDVAFVTHHHGDHFNIPTLRILARNGKSAFVLPRPCLKRAANLEIAKERIIVPAPGHPLETNGIRVEPIHAIHGNQEFTVLTREPDFAESIAQNCGYVFNMQGKRVLHPGDSVLTEEHLALKNIDVLFVSPTIHNMYVDRSMILINRLEPGYIFPQHFGTYVQTDENSFWTRGYPDELKLRLSRQLQQRYHKLNQGQMFVIR